MGKHDFPGNGQRHKQPNTEQLLAKMSANDRKTANIVFDSCAYTCDRTYYHGMLGPMGIFKTVDRVGIAPTTCQYLTTQSFDIFHFVYIDWPWNVLA